MVDEKRDFELDPVTSITAGAVGAPGRRTFFIQARKDSLLVSLKCEKEQVEALTSQLGMFVQRLDAELGSEDAVVEEILSTGLKIEEPAVEEWAVGEMTVGYDPDRDMLVVTARALDDDDDDEDASEARFWMTRPQAMAMCLHGIKVLAEGRPLCPWCTLPVDPEGHSCPARN